MLIRLLILVIKTGKFNEHKSYCWFNEKVTSNKTRDIETGKKLYDLLGEV